MKTLKNHIILSVIAMFATNVYFLMWLFIDHSAMESDITEGISFFEFMTITNGALLIISVFSITYKDLGDSFLSWGYSNVFRFVSLITLSVFIFGSASVLLIGIHINSTTKLNSIRTILIIVQSSHFSSLLFFFTLVSILMFFISNLERRSGNVYRLIAQSMGNALKPKLVNRGFMFIDLNDATSLAEDLGGEKYAMLLRDCFHLLNDLIDVSNFEVYQYVGDEAVITWKLSVVNADFKALQLFSDFKAYLKENESHFVKVYGLQPKFKCAIHSGEVVQSEIGKEMKHLVYHGDVLNTASRLLSQCHPHKTDIIISKDAAINIDKISTYYNLIPIACYNLKGKRNKVHAYTTIIKNRTKKLQRNLSQFFFKTKMTNSHFTTNTFLL